MVWMVSELRLIAATIVLSRASVWSFSLLPLQTARSSPFQVNLAISSSFSDQVTVYDNVFTSDVCSEMHDLAVDHADRSPDGSSVFFRKKTCTQLDGDDLTPLERALDSCLTELGDTTSTVVEYWSRQEHINIDVHSDMDEEELEESGRILCPEWGHVLYLELDVAHGPTVVFDQMGGWRQPSNGGVDLVTVPAVVGRVLRFPGSAMHAVPQPVDRWLLTDVEESAIRDREREEINQHKNDDNNDDEVDDEWDDDNNMEDEDDDDDDVIERSVILFNTWGDIGPRGVIIDPVGGSIPDGIDLDAGVNGYIASQRKQQFEDWKDDFGGDDFPVLHCQPKNYWMEQELALSSTTEASSPRVALMGQKVRRLHPKKNVRFSNQGDLKQALYENSAPTFLSGK